jgi:undecaprenyl-diphosphatase
MSARRLSRPSFELRLLWPIALLGVASWSFLKIAGEVLEGDAHSIDTLILQWCRASGRPDHLLGPIWLQEAMRDLTALGSPAVLILTVGAVWGYLMVARQRTMAWLAAGSALGGRPGQRAGGRLTRVPGRALGI